MSGSFRFKRSEGTIISRNMKRILERLLIDLSWASSHMEGNTYNLFETERLIRFGQEASGKGCAGLS